MKLNDLMNNSYIWAVLSMVTIISLLFSVFTWIKNRKKKCFSYFKRSYVVLISGKDAIPRLKLLYNDKEIDSLIISKYVIWNSGNEVLEYSDIAKSNPLEIKIKDNESKILDAKIIEKSKESNMFAIEEKTEEKIKFYYEYADIQDGIIVQILHTGNEKSIGLDGIIKGGKIKEIQKSFAEEIETENLGSGCWRKYIIIILILLSSSLIVKCLEYFGIVPVSKMKLVNNNGVVFLSPPEYVYDWLVEMFFAVWAVICSVFSLYIFLKKDNYIDIPKKFREKMKDDILKFK